MVTISALTLSAVAFGQQPEQEEAPEPVATVNDSDIKADRVKQSLADWSPGPTVKRLIDQELLRQEAARRGVEITDEQVQARLEAEEKDPWELERYLGRRGVSRAQYAEQLRWDLMLSTLADALRDRSARSQAKAYFEAHRSEFSSGPQVNIFEIVTDDIKDAYLARERIAGGESFTQVAAEMSIADTEDGHVGWMPRQEYHLGPQIADLQVGQVSAPLRSDHTYYLVYIKEYTEQRQAKYDDVKDQIIQQVRDRMDFTDEDYLELLARRANISIQHDDFAYLTDYFQGLEEIRVMVEGRLLDLDPKPRRLESGHLVVILKPLLQQVGASVTWEHENGTMIAQNPMGRASVTVGKTAAEIGKRTRTSVKLPTAPMLENGRVVGPPRTILEALGAQVTWDGVRNVLEIVPPEIPEEAKTTGGLETAD